MTRGESSDAGSILLAAGGFEARRWLFLFGVQHYRVLGYPQDSGRATRFQGFWQDFKPYRAVDGLNYSATYRNLTSRRFH
jgi:hypothetical protein